MREFFSGAGDCLRLAVEVLTLLYVTLQILPIVFLWLLRRRRPTRGTLIYPPVSILVPVKGPTENLKANLLSLLEQAYPGPTELILAVQDKNDPDLAVIQELQAQYPHIRVLCGLARLGLNPKNSNLVHAVRAARYPWIYCSDSDTRIAPNHLQHAQSLINQDETCFVTAMSVHESPRTLGAILEVIGTNVELPNYFLFSHTLGKHTAMNGASMLFHGSLLSRAGGFESFLNKLTDDLALQLAFQKAGGRGILSPLMTRVKLSRQSLKGFWQRQQRWYLIGKCFARIPFFLFSPINWIPQWLLVFALLLWNRNLLVLGVSLLVLRMIRSLIFQIGLGTPFRDWWKSLFMFCYDLSAPFIWLSCLRVREISWAGQSLSVASDGKLELKSVQ